MNFNRTLFFVFLFFIFLQSVHSQELNKKLFNGFFNFEYQEKTNKIFLEVEKTNEEFLYVSSLTTGLGSNDIGLDRGQLGQERIVKFKKYGNKILLIQPNSSFVALTNNDASC